MPLTDGELAQQHPGPSRSVVSIRVSKISYPVAAPIGQDGPVIEHAERPWGSYTVLAEGDRFKVKTIEVRPGQRLSYQRHTRRGEHWFVVAGQGVITLDGVTIEVRSGDWNRLRYSLISARSHQSPYSARAASSISV